MMLNIYLKKEDIKNNLELIEDNDILFNYDLYNTMKVNPFIEKIMKSFDGATYLQGMDMRSKLGNVTSMENLSTGCKTIINIINHPELVISCIECGNNALYMILKNIKKGNVLFEILPSVEDLNINANLIINKGNFKINNVKDFINFSDSYLLGSSD